MKESVFQTVPFPQWGYIYSSVSRLGLQGPFSLEDTECICIYCMSSIQALNKKYRKCLPEEISQSFKNFPSIIPHTFLSASFLPPTSHHLSKENHARLLNSLVIIRSCYGTLVCLRNGVCMVCGEKCNLVLHPFCWNFNWSHGGNTKLR